MHIENIGPMDANQVEREISKMDDPTLIAQSRTQKGAIHVLETLIEIGVTHANASALLESLQGLGILVQKECSRRGLQAFWGDA